MIRPWRLRLPRSRIARVGILALLLAAVVGGSWWLWPAGYALAVEVRDKLGLRLVEGHAEAIQQAAEESEVDPLLIAAVMFMESRGRGGQTSYAGAHGLMQLIPGAASDAARRLGLPEPSVEELLEDDELNIRLGAAHLAWLLEHRGEWSLEAVLVSYNAGRVKLMRWIEREGSYEAWRRAELGRHRREEKTTGALAYAVKALEVRERLRERGRIGG